jgi:hypothetical protein
LLKIARAVKFYSSLRKKEFKSKSKLLKQLKTANSFIKKIQTNLPKIRIRKGTENDYREKKSGKEKLKYDQSIEDELLEIRKKLMTLQ